MNNQTEILIIPARRGYRFTLPEWCAPCPNAVFGLKQLIRGYNRDKQVRMFPADKLAAVVGFLSHWYVEPNPLTPTLNRNGGQICSVRVAEAEAMEVAA